ncbi:MAG: hypothetical protein JNK24_08065 [Alphaproteobacteria bacterium]|nr:hypothetical protein [Alphaproteobacteria bacterium]
MISRLFTLINPSYRRAKRRARRVFEGVMAQTRRPDFYTHFAIPDDFDGRFEVLSLHSALFLKALQVQALQVRAQSPQTGASARDYSKMSQAYFDVMFENLDYALREMGVGDLGVPRRIKKYMMAFHGRAKAYEAGLGGATSPSNSPPHDSPRHDLAAAIARNIYFGHEAAGAANSMALASYAQQCFELMSAEMEQILSTAEFRFPALPRQNKAA